MITVSNVAVQFGKRVLYNDVNMKFTNGNIYGVIGANGAGKSTFLKVISGELDPTKGSVTLGPGERLSVLSQDHFKFDAHTVLDTVLMGHTVLWDIMKQRDALYAKEDFTDEDGIKAAELEEKFAELEGWNAESDAAILLSGLGIKEDKHGMLMGDLSGKEKVRVMLAQALFGNPDNLLLDEPTNDLDIMTLQVLEEFLQGYGGCLIVISHDRYFMDKVADHLLVFQGGGQIKDFPGNYSDYLEWKRLKESEERAAGSRENKKIQEKQMPKQSSAPSGKRKRTYQENREMERLEQEIPQLEQEKAELERLLGSGSLSVGELTAKSVRIGEVIALIDEKSMRWLELSEIAG